MMRFYSQRRWNFISQEKVVASAVRQACSLSVKQRPLVLLVLTFTRGLKAVNELPRLVSLCADDSSCWRDGNRGPPHSLPRRAMRSLVATSCPFRYFQSVLDSYSGSRSSIAALPSYARAQHTWGRLRRIRHAPRPRVAKRSVMEDACSRSVST